MISYGFQHQPKPKSLKKAKTTICKWDFWRKLPKIVFFAYLTILMMMEVHEILVWYETKQVLSISNKKKPHFLVLDSKISQKRRFLAFFGIKKCPTIYDDDGGPWNFSMIWNQTSTFYFQ